MQEGEERKKEKNERHFQKLTLAIVHVGPWRLRRYVEYVVEGLGFRV